jgi:hypothetical protein
LRSAWRWARARPCRRRAAEGADRAAEGQAAEGRAEEEWVGRSFPAAGREWAGRGRLEGLRRSNEGRGRRAVRGCSLGLRDAGGTTGPPSRA